MDMKIGWLHSIAVHPMLQQIRLAPGPVCTGIGKAVRHACPCEVKSCKKHMGYTGCAHLVCTMKSANSAAPKPERGAHVRSSSLNYFAVDEVVDEAL